MTLLEDLQARTGLGRLELLSIVRGAPRRYKVFTIPKRTGGERVIAQPAREVKVLQRLMVDHLLYRLPVHDAATAYQEGRSIKANAAAHATSSVILKLDFADFFPSIKVGDWTRYCRALDQEVAQRAGLSTAEDIAVSSRILFWGRGTFEPRCLSIGAPSSPIVSNVLLARFDTAVAQEAAALQVGYTRYADDITLSADRSDRLLAVEAFIERYLKRHKSPSITLNVEKRGLYTSGQKRMVTGLVITPEKKVSLGRSRKRMILSLVNDFRHGKLSAEATAHIQGYVAFAKDIEPAFHSLLERKYGKDAMSRLAAFRLPREVHPPKRRRVL